MFNKFLKVLRLNVIFTRVILLSFLVICSVPNKIFSITFWSSWTMKCFKPCLPGAVCICYDKWIFSNRSIHAVRWKTSTKLFVLSSSSIFLKASIWKLIIPLDIFYTPSKRLLKFFLTFFVFLLQCNLQHQNWVHF